MSVGRKGAMKALGPGLMFAAVSVGVSHLVQCTRAGAGYGLSLIGVVILVLVLKYPLFEFGHRYAVATGTSLLAGFRRQGKWGLGLYFILTLGTMFTVVAAVTAVTAGMAVQLTGLSWSMPVWSCVLIASGCLILAIGRYPLLDKVIKVIMVLLVVSTVAATVAVLPKLSGMRLFAPIDFSQIATVTFVVGLMGWMPTGMDVSVLQSLWVLARQRETGHAPTMREARLDFQVGYFGTGLLAVMFCILGTSVMFGRDVAFESSAGGFARQVIDLYTASLGEWSRPVIVCCAFTTMFSTVLTVLDGFPRALDLLCGSFWKEELPYEGQPNPERSFGYWSWMAVLVIGAGSILFFSMASMTSLVDLATILSFVTAPFLGILSYRSVTGSWVKEEHRPGWVLRTVAIIGMIFLSCFLLFYLYSRFLM